jgi:small subunit ribosomal protein S24e
MTDNAITVRTKQFLKNPLLNRRQCVVEVLHPGAASVSKKDIREKLAKMFKVKEMEAVVPYGFKVIFGGGRSTGMVGCLLPCPPGLEGGLQRTDARALALCRR